MKALTQFIFALCFALFGIAQAAPTQKDAQALVEKAAAYVKTSGKDKLLAQIADKAPEWNSPDLYVFAYDLTGTIIGDPNPKMVGKNLYDVPDADGKLFRKEIIDGAKASGNGWVNYRFKNPTTGNVDAKTAYFLRVGDIVLVAGIFKN